MPTFEVRWRSLGQSEAAGAVADGGTDFGWTSWREPRRFDTAEEMAAASLDPNSKVYEDLDGRSLSKWSSSYDYQFRDETGRVVWSGSKTRDAVVQRGVFLNGRACDTSQPLLRTWSVPMRRRFRQC